MSMFSNKTPVTIEPPAPAMPVSGVPGGPGGYGESEIHLLDRLSVLYRYRNIVIAVVTVVLIGGAVQTYTTTKEYKAAAIVQIDPDRPTIQGLTQAMYSAEEDAYAAATEFNNLRSHTLARRVARKLNLAANREYNGQDPQATGLGDALLSLRTRITQPITSLFKKPEPVAPPTKAEANKAEGTKAADADSDETPEEAARVQALLAHQGVTQILGTRQYSVEVWSRYPQFAADAANAFVDEYVQQNYERKTQNLALKRDMYDAQVKKLQNEIEVRSKQYQDLARSTPQGAYIDPGQLAATVAAVKQDWNKAQDKELSAQGEYKRLAEVDLKDDDAAMNAAKTVPGFATDPIVVSQLQAIENKNQEKSRVFAANQYGPEHPVMKGLNADIASFKGALKQRLTTLVEAKKNEWAAARESAARYRDQFQEVDTKSVKQVSEGINLQSLADIIKTKRDSLDNVSKQAEDATVQASSTHNNARKADPAQVPGAPFRPNATQNMLMALLGGLVIAFGLAFGLDYLDDTVKTPEDITRKLHVPFLGLVPSVRGEKQPVLSGPVPHDFGESYRALRTSLVFTSGGESTRVITVTSAQPLEGKTTTACNLAMVLAFGGSRVLLLDADMRRPGVHKALKINNTVGLSHLLVGQARVREAIQRTSDPNFCVMTAGRTPPNPSELLSSERMRQLVANLKQGPFDWVVIDTPPVLAVTDAVILTPLVDGVTFVVGAEMTRRRLAERAVHMIMASRPKVVGAVLNRVNFDRNKYYYSRYYGYQYKSYYGTHTSTSTATATKD